MQKQRKLQQQINLVVTVKASDDTFPGLELAQILERYARFVRKSTYTGELNSDGTFLDMSGGVLWDIPKEVK